MAPAFRAFRSEAGTQKQQEWRVTYAKQINKSFLLYRRLSCLRGLQQQMLGSLIPTYFGEVHSCHKQTRTQRMGVTFPTGVSQRYSHSPSSPPRAWSLRSCRSLREYRGQKAVGNSGRSEDQQGGVVLLITELGEGWHPQSQEKRSSFEGAVQP